MPAISKITAKGQTTVPQEVRVALNSKPGDLIAWTSMRTDASPSAESSPQTSSTCRQCRAR